MEALGLDAEEMFKALGLPFVDSDDGLAWRVLRDHVDAVDVAIIRKLASGRRRRLQRRPPTASDALSTALLSSVERQLRGPAASLNAAQTALELLVGKGPGGTGSLGH